MMWNDPNSKYLFAFEAAVIALIGGYEQARKFSTGLRDGLWCNAHMWHGIGLDAELAAAKFVGEVVEMPPSSDRKIVAQPEGTVAV
jgi:hypothetical protein